MYFASDLYNPQNRYVHSESYFNPKEKINITENRLGCNTFNPNHHASAMASNTPFGTIRKNRLRLLRNPHFRIGHSDNKLNDDTNDSNGNSTNSNANGQQEQLYVKIGEMNPASSEYDYSGMRWTQQHQEQQQQQQLQEQQQQQSDQYHQRPMYHDHSQPPMQSQSAQQNNAQSNQSIYENHHRQNSDKDMIYAPSANRNIISNYITSNKRFDEV